MWTIVPVVRARMHIWAPAPAGAQMYVHALDHSGTTFSACGPLGPWVISNSTRWFSSSER